MIRRLANYGLKIRYFTSDSFESKAIHQNVITILKGRVFRDIISCDKSPDPYNTLKQVINDGRLIMPPNTVLKRELLQLERRIKRDMTIPDHPENGSKDLADALAGVVVHVLENAPLAWREHGYRPYQEKTA